MPNPGSTDTDTDTTTAIPSMFNDYQESPPGYTMLKMIGRGGFGDCWMALHQLTGCKVAIKVIPRRGDLKMLEREISLWKNLQHPNIVQLYEVIPMKENIYLAMEYVEEGELFNVLSRFPKGLPLSRALDIFAQVCVAVDFLHRRGLAHRDIKLENVFLEKDGRTVKLGDFGFATYTDGGRSEEWLGSAEYTAPEVLKNQPYQPEKADSWSLGVLLYALIKGYLPFSEVEDERIKDEEEVDKKVKNRIMSGNLQIPRDIDAKVRAILTNLLTQDPNKRWPVSRVLSQGIIKRHTNRSQQLNLQTPSNDTIKRIKLCELSGISNTIAINNYPSVDTIGAIVRIVNRDDSFRNKVYQDKSNPSTSDLSLDDKFIMIDDESKGKWGNSWFDKFNFWEWTGRYKNVGSKSNSSSESPELSSDL